MRSLVFAIIAVILVFGSGCGTVRKHLFTPNSNQVYGGTREDCHAILHKDYETEPVRFRVESAVDLPFSFAFDTILLPFDIYTWTEQPPSVDPLKNWKYVGGLDLITNKNDPANLPFNSSVKDDVQKVIKEHDFKYGPGSIFFDCYGSVSFYEDGTGKHAVRMKIPLDMRGDTVVIYILIYDQHDVRTKVHKYKEWRPASFG